MLLRKENWMANYLEYSSDQERYEKERLAHRVYAAKVFRFIFKNTFDKLLFVRTLSIKGVRFDLCIDDVKKEWLCVKGDNISSSYLSMKFSKDQADFIDRYFPNFDDRKKYRACRNNFSYAEFPVKSMIEAAIGEAILHSLDSQSGNFEIFLEDCNGNKTSFFKASSVEELNIKMDLESI